MKAQPRTKEPQTAQQPSQPTKEKEYPAIVSLQLRQAKLEQLQNFEIAFDGYDIH
ncbi:14046_t:CDS:2 [Funneliformis geosporum]|uniref:14046_t:CDS:1 n=1 Tax=Funneliformis geosporum TaxID=1117311 RepID=A0A9W4SZU9_9GLOM|nr:14046_t:CDS:2 [Funneliformis geosporum]